MYLGTGLLLFDFFPLKNNGFLRTPHCCCSILSSSVVDFLEEATVLQGEKRFKFFDVVCDSDFMGLWCLGLFRYVIGGGFFMEWCLMVVFNSAMTA